LQRTSLDQLPERFVLAAAVGGGFVEATKQILCQNLEIASL
jgi:hypothetical protein